MKIFKRVFLGIFGFLAILLFIIFIAIENNTILNYIAKEGIKASNLDIKYKELNGGLISGVELKEVNYQNNIKATLKLEINYSKLLAKRVEIETLEVTDIFVDKNYIENLADENTTTKEEKKSEPLKIPYLKDVKVNNILITTKELGFKEYQVERAFLNIKDIFYSFEGKFKANIKKIDILSNVANIDVNGKATSKNYQAIAKIEPKIEFVSKFVSEQNITLEKLPTINLIANGTFSKVDINASLDEAKILFNEFIIEPQKINLLANFDLEKNDLLANLQAKINSNIANLFLDTNSSLNLKDINSTLNYQAKTNILTNSTFLKKHYLKDVNLTFLKSPDINIEAKGDLKSVDVNLNLKALQILFQNFNIEPNFLTLKANYNLIKNSLLANLKTDINSNIANLFLDTNSSLNLNDINNTLKFEANSIILANQKFIKKNYLKDVNLSIKNMPKLSLRGVGNLKNIDLNASLGKGRVKFNEFDIKAKYINVIANYNLITKDIKSKIKSKVLSNAANIDLNSKVSLNTNNIDKSLKYKADTDILAQKKFIYQKTKDLNLTINSIKPLKIVVNGDLNRLKANINFLADAKLNNISLKPKIHNSTVDFNIKSNSLKGSVNLDLLTSMANIYSGSDFELNLKDIDKTLNYSTTIDIKDTNIKDVNLKRLEPFNLKANGGVKDLNIKLTSPKITLFANSKNMKRFDLDLKTKEVNIQDIIKLPKELLAKFVNLNAQGFYDIEKKRANFDANLNINQKVKFKLKAIQNSQNLDVRVDNEALNLEAKGNLEPLNINSNLKISSIKKLQNLIKKLYVMESLDVDGKLDIKSNLQKDNINLEIASKKIKYDTINIKNFLTKMDYNKDTLLLKKLEFSTSGFKERDLNRDFRLTREGVVKLGEKITFDIAFNHMINLIGFKDKEEMSANLEIKKFPLELKEYGKLKINSKINFKQKEQKSYLTGNIDLYDVDLYYEAKFLSIDKDKDIVIITKKDKEAKKQNNKKQMSDFDKNFFIDLKINNLNKARYKVEGAEIDFIVDLAIKKEFNNTLRVLGKIKDINGFYDLKGKKFLIENSTVAMRGLKEINPLLDIKLKHSLPEIIIYIYVTGDKNRPKIKFVSEPLMSKKEIFSYLIFGTSSENIAKGSKKGNYNKTAALFLSNAMTKDIAESLGLDKIELSEGKEGKGVDVKVGKRLARNLMIIYKNSADKNSIKMEYEIDKNWGVESESGESENSVDIFFKKKY